MSLSIIFAPHPVFKQKATAVAQVDDRVRRIVTDMYDVMYANDAVGIGANMVGLLERICVIDTREDGNRSPITLINPEILRTSDAVQTHTESSLSFPYISAEITRPSTIHLRYLNEKGELNDLEATGFLSQVIQHEVDYLNGVTFLDHLSRTRRDMLLKKMQKQVKLHPPHIHGAGCSHHHH